MHRWWQRSRTPLVGCVLSLVILTGGGLSSLPQQATPEVSPTPAGAPMSEITVTHGLASGDVTAASANIWARASDGPAQMHVEYATDRDFSGASRAQSDAGAITTATDYTGVVPITDLNPDTTYYYRVWFTGDNQADDRPPLDSPAGSFRTALAAGTSRPISFVVGGDLGGQQYCRRPDEGYGIFAAMSVLTPDFFIANGDLIYADGACPAGGPEAGAADWQNIPGDFPSIADPDLDWTDPEAVRQVYLRHWRYNRADPYYQQFLQQTPVYAQWDDHEVINDFGAQWDVWNPGNADRAGFPNLVEAGTDTFFAYNPITRHADEPNRIYRAFNWGEDADLFILDQRSYRSENRLADTPENEKTLLGAEQLDWLKQGRLASDATWKVISADVPISIQTGGNADEFGRDGWANGIEEGYSAETGFERELTDLLTFLDDNDIENVVFVVTDVHFTMNIGYETDPNGDGDDLVFHEFVSGPLNAIAVDPPELDPTFNPTTLYSEGNLFNFSYVRIEPGTDGSVHLLADVRGADVRQRPGSLVDLTPR